MDLYKTAKKRLRLHHLGPDTLAVVAAQPDMDDLAALMARGRDHDRNIQPGVAGEEGAGEGSLQQNVVCLLYTSDAADE